MIRLSFLFEDTKIKTGEKVAAGLGLAGGLGIGSLGHKIKTDADADILHHKLDPAWSDTPNGIVTQDISDISKAARNFGLGTAAAIGAGLAAHKLYKNYKAKKNKENK